MHIHSLHTGVQSPNTSALLQCLGLAACLVLLCCCANQLTAALCHCLFTPMQSTLHTDLQSPYTSALLQCLGLPACLVLLCCCANQLTAALCHCLFTPMKIHTAYRCAFTIHQCTAAVFMVNCLPCSSVLLCQPADSSLVPLFIYTYEDPHCIQVCIHHTPVHCCSV